MIADTTHPGHCIRFKFSEHSSEFMLHQNQLNGFQDVGVEIYQKPLLRPLYCTTDRITLHYIKLWLK